MTTTAISTTTITVIGDPQRVMETTTITVTAPIQSPIVTRSTTKPGETEFAAVTTIATSTSVNLVATQTVTIVAEPQRIVETITVTSLTTVVLSPSCTNDNGMVSPSQNIPGTAHISQDTLSTMIQATVTAIASHSLSFASLSWNSDTNSEISSEKDLESVSYTQSITTTTTNDVTNTSTSRPLPTPSPLSPPPCSFPALALNENFDGQVSNWEILPLQLGTSVVFVTSSAFNQIHSGTRSGRARFGATTVPFSQFTIESTLTQVCAGAEYTLSAWFRSPLPSTTQGRVCRAKFTWTDTLQGTTANINEIINIAIPEDGNWGIMQGVFAVGEAAQGGQIQLQVFCEAGPERYVFWDDFVIQRNM